MAIAATTLPGCENCDERDGEQHCWKHENHVEGSRDGGVDPPTEVTGEHTQWHGKRRRGEHGRHCDEQTHAKPEEYAAEHISAEYVGTEWMLQARRTEHALHLDRFGVVRRDRRCSDGDDREQDEDRQSHDDQPGG